MQTTSFHHSGDPRRERFHVIYDAYASDVAAFALRRRPAADAADVVAETFVVAWRRIDEIPPDAETRTWLLRVARRIVAAQSRGQRRREQLAEELAERFEERYTSPPPIERLEQLSTVGAALKKLSESDRELLLLVAWDELQPNEIGDLLGLPSPVVRKRLQRARNRLRQQLRRLDDTGADIGDPAIPKPAIGMRANPGGLR